MSNLHDILETYVSNGSVPEAVGPMARDSIFRIASITKPITAAAVMMLVEDSRIALDDPVGQWLL
jgi:CubicO group peptidase (beta-lactamase class C family)